MRAFGGESRRRDTRTKAAGELRCFFCERLLSRQKAAARARNGALRRVQSPFAKHQSSVTSAEHES